MFTLEVHKVGYNLLSHIVIRVEGKIIMADFAKITSQKELTIERSYGVE